jgi:hypothetical protein
MLTGLQIGIGTTGALLATAPLAYSATLIGWRGSFLAVGAITLLIGVMIALVVRDDDRAQGSRPETLRESLAGILDVIRTPSVGPVFVMNLVVYSSFAMIAGLWGGPYLTHIYGYGLEERGTLLLLPAITQIIGLVAWGPMDRIFGSYRLPVLLGAGLTAAALAYLAVFGKLSPGGIAVWLAAFGLFSSYGAVLVAHGRVLFPLELVGRGLTVLNVGSMGGTFLVQLVTGAVIGLFPTAPAGPYALDAYRLVFALQAAFILLGCLVYFRARDVMPPSGSGPSPAQ